MNKKIKAVAIFLIILIGGIATSLALDIESGFLPSFFLAAALAIWYCRRK